MTVNIPPSIGAAMRWVTSEPVAVLSMIGMRPAMVDTDVITTGRTRLEVAVRTASLTSSGVKRAVLAERLFAIDGIDSIAPRSAARVRGPARQDHVLRGIGQRSVHTAGC